MMLPYVLRTHTSDHSFFRHNGRELPLPRFINGKVIMASYKAEKIYQHGANFLFSGKQHELGPSADLLYLLIFPASQILFFSLHSVIFIANYIWLHSISNIFIRC